MNFTIDTLGRCIDLEIPDTCRRQTIIVKERTLELLRTALAGIDSFQPATERGEKFLTDRRWNTILPISLK